MVKLPERRFRLGGLMLTLAMAVAIGSAAPCSAADVIKIGALVQLSGGAAFLGPSEEAAYRMAVAEINKNGGVLGKKL